jgi:beta-1,4-N-acetylglucosaminyltransferase
MIFVTVGSSTIPFDRLLEAVDAIGLEERAVVQHGTSAIRPRRAEHVDFVDYEAFVGLVREARVTITHGGVGSIMTALSQGKRPIVVPRRRRMGEAVDDHQVAFARRAAELRLIELVEDVDHLENAIARSGFEATLSSVSASPVEIALRADIESLLVPEAQRSAERSPA